MPSVRPREAEVCAPDPEEALPSDTEKAPTSQKTGMLSPGLKIISPGLKIACGGATVGVVAGKELDRACVDRAGVEEDRGVGLGVGQGGGFLSHSDRQPTSCLFCDTCKIS